MSRPGPEVSTLADADYMKAHIAVGRMLLTPNRIRSTGDLMGIFARGTAGGALVLDIFDESGELLGSIGVTLDVEGFGVATFDGHLPAGRRLPPALYWAVGRGGGVADRKAFLVTP